MKIQFISRKEIINQYLDMVISGYKLTKEDIEFLKDMANGAN